MNLIVAISVVLGMFSPGPVNDSADDTAAVRQVLTNWEKGVETKNRELLESMWLFPQAMNLRIPSGGTEPGYPERAEAQRYVDYTVKDEGSASLKFTEVKIEIIGTDLARVHAVWHYYRDGKEVAYGNDVMSLVRTQEEWKLVSVIWDRQRVGANE